jgi:hypothetical protein
MNNEKITINKTTAVIAIQAISDFVEWTERFDKETRAQIIALDDLINATDYEQEYNQKVDQIREEMKNRQAEFEARKLESGAN